jgi:hypothetical protein
MDTRSLHPGDRVEANIRGLIFTAKVIKSADQWGIWRILPDRHRITYRSVTSRQIVKKLDPQEQLGVGR